MAKFSMVSRGTRARKMIKLPLFGATVDPESGAWTGPTDTLDVRALGDEEYADVLRDARAFAKKRGVENPESGDELYERGLMLHTLAIACIDHESSEDKPQPYFDDWEQIHKSPLLIPEVVSYLYLQQRLQQDDVNPLRKNQTPAEFYAAAIKTAGGDMSFFVNSRPGMQWSFLRTLASQLVASLSLSSDSSSSSGPQAETSH